MHSIRADNFDPGKIADSGQCFRMRYVRDSTYAVIAYGKYVEVKQQDGNEFVFSCSQEEYEELWKSYFDLDTDYNQMTTEFELDRLLTSAVEFGNGIRILKQELWEVLITFIISQRKTIRSIRGCVNSLCYRFGEWSVGMDMLGNPVTYYKFPTPDVLGEASLEELRACGLGYRDVYVRDAALWFRSNIDVCRQVLYSQDDRGYTNSKNLLMQLHGIGNKVANCVCLFGLHHLQACPIDTHMQQIIDEEYHGVIPAWMTSEYAGVLQQYCFFYKRMALGRVITHNADAIWEDILG